MLPSLLVIVHELLFLHSFYQVFFFSFSRLFISKTREYVFTLLIFNDILFIHEQPHECTEMRICINNNKKKIR